MTFVLTGTFSTYGRSRKQQALSKALAESKLEKAQQLGIKVIDEEEFKKMIV